MFLTIKEKAVGLLIFLIIVLPAIVFSFEFTSFLYPKEFVLGIILLLLMPFILAEKKEFVVPTPLFFFFILNIFLLVTFFYAKVPEQTLIRASELFLVVITLFLLTSFIKEEKYDTYFEWGILLSGMLVAISLVVQYYDVLPVLFPKYSFYNQLYSVFGNQNLAGGYIAIVMTSLLVHWDKIQTRDIYKFLFLFILGYGLILSNSRSSWLSIVIIFPFLLVKKYRGGNWNKGRLLYFGGVIFLIIMVTFPIIYERIKYSFSSIDVGFRVRLWIYDGAIRMFLANPFLGVGFGNFYYWSPKFLGDALHSSYGNIHIRNELLTLHAHNDILELVCEAGMLGFPLVFLFYFSPLYLYRDNYVWWVFVIYSLLNPILISSSHLIISFLVLFKCKGRVGRENTTNLIGVSINKFLCIGEKKKYFFCGLGVVTILFLFNALWFPDYKLRQAEKLLILGQDCEKQYQNLVHFRFSTYAMYEGYAQQLMVKGDYKNAYEVLKKALEKTDGGNVYLMLGRCSEELGKKEESIKWYRECLYRFPNNEYAQEYLRSIEDLK